MGINIGRNASRFSFRPPVLFVYINDLVDNIGYDVRMVADDTFLFSYYKRRTNLQMGNKVTLKR